MLGCVVQALSSCVRLPGTAGFFAFESADAGENDVWIDGWLEALQCLLLFRSFKKALAIDRALREAARVAIGCEVCCSIAGTAALHELLQPYVAGMGDVEAVVAIAVLCGGIREYGCLHACGYAGDLFAAEGGAGEFPAGCAAGLLRGGSCRIWLVALFLQVQFMFAPKLMWRDCVGIAGAGALLMVGSPVRGELWTKQAAQLACCVDVHV